MKPYVTPPYPRKYTPGKPDRQHGIADRMNIIIDAAMKTDATHIFFNDGDVECPPETIDTLIRHNVDVASGVYPYHNYDSSHAMVFGRMGKNNPCGHLIPRDWDYMAGKVWGEKEPWSGGSGCLLVRRRVFKRHHQKITPIRFSKDGDCGLDILFWKRVQDAGFTARIDANIVCGHLPKYPLAKIDEWL